MIGRVLVSVAAAILMTGCSSVIEGTTQILTLNSYPAGADCVLTRDGLTIGNVITPGRLIIEKTKHDIQVTCSKDDHENSTMIVKSDAAGATFGNAIFGTAVGGIGWAFDSVSGADNKYNDVVNVHLNRKR